MGHIGHVDHATILTAGCFQTLHAATIDAQPNWLVCRFPRNQCLHEDRTQALYVDASILQRFVDTWPATLEKDRQRQFGQAACLRLAEQCIAQVEERIPTALKAAIHLLTNLVQCVKVHLSNAPWFCFSEHYSCRHASARRPTFWLPLV